MSEYERIEPPMKFPHVGRVHKLAKRTIVRGLRTPDIETEVFKERPVLIISDINECPNEMINIVTCPIFSKAYSKFSIPISNEYNFSRKICFIDPTRTYTYLFAYAGSRVTTSVVCSDPVFDLVLKVRKLLDKATKKSYQKAIDLVHEYRLKFMACYNIDEIIQSVGYGNLLHTPISGEDYYTSGQYTTSFISGNSDGEREECDNEDDGGIGLDNNTYPVDPEPVGLYTKDITKNQKSKKISRRKKKKVNKRTAKDFRFNESLVEEQTVDEESISLGDEVYSCGDDQSYLPFKDLLVNKDAMLNLVACQKSLESKVNGVNLTNESRDDEKNSSGEKSVYIKAKNVSDKDLCTFMKIIKSSNTVGEVAVILGISYPSVKRRYENFIAEMRERKLDYYIVDWNFPKNSSVSKKSSKNELVKA